jgi:hypothetical protein
MTMVLPSCALAEYLLAAVETILDKLTAVTVLVVALGGRCAFGSLTRAVDLAHHKTAEDNLVEGGIGTAYCCQHTHLRILKGITYEPGTCRDAPTT